MPTAVHAPAPERAARDVAAPKPAGPVAVLRRKCACGGGAGMDDSCDDCRKKRLQKKSATTGTTSDVSGGAPQIVRDVLATPGRPLDASDRAFAEARFGQSFGHVRIHADDRAAESARAVDAHAYTVGNHVVFGAGRFAPATRSGKWLLAHELAHTVQQQGAEMPPIARLALGREDDPSEAAADRAADAAMAGGAVPSLSPSAGAIRRSKVTKVVQDGEDDRTAHMDDGKRVKIHRIRTLSEEKVLDDWTNVKPGADRKRLFLEIEWCSGANHGTVKVGANVPEKVVNVIVEAVTSGKDLKEVLKGVDISPFAEADVLQSGEFHVKATGEVTIDREGKVTGGKGGLKVTKGPFDFEANIGSERVGDKQDIRGGLTVTITPGRKTEKKDCRKIRKQVVENQTFECKSERDVPGMKGIEDAVVTDRQSSFIYFEYEKDVVAPRSAESIEALTKFLSEGYKVAGVRGFTSPEGPMAKKRGFIGNEELSRRRAVAAAKVAQASCKAAGAEDADSCLLGGKDSVTLTGRGELYTLVALDDSGVEKEVEGAPLAEHATAEFLKQDDEARHRTPELTKKLEDPGTTAQQKADLVYPLLRRAEIKLVRNRVVAGNKGVPGRVDTSVIECDEDVVKAAFPDAKARRVIK